MISYKYQVTLLVTWLFFHHITHDIFVKLIHCTVYRIAPRSSSGNTFLLCHNAVRAAAAAAANNN